MSPVSYCFLLLLGILFYCLLLPGTLPAIQIMNLFLSATATELDAGCIWNDRHFIYQE